MKICIQAGHWGKAGSGAPEEQANNKRIADRVSALLRERKFEVYQADWYANTDTKVTSTDWDLFLALHCDMDYPNDGGSGFADYADPATDSATTESQRICKIINETYFPEVKINYVSHSNANTRFYYVWKYLTAKTPCVLLEMGQSIDPHDKVLLANTELIASAIVRSICKAFNVAYDITPTVEPWLAEKANLIKEIELLKSEIENLKSNRDELITKLTDKTEEVLVCQSNLETANKLNQNIQADVDYYKPFKALYEAALKKTIDKYSGWELIRMGVTKLTVKK